MQDALAAHRVAGVSAPAFVEREPHEAPETPGSGFTSVAGVSAPAFVERGRQERQADIVSMCRRGLGPGLR